MCITWGDIIKGNIICECCRKEIKHDKDIIPGSVEHILNPPAYMRHPYTNRVYCQMCADERIDAIEDRITREWRKRRSAEIKDVDV